MTSKKFARWVLTLVGLVLIVLSPMMPTQAAAEDFTIIVLPDTQFYSQSYPQTFIDQTDWIVANKEALNIVQVVHVGDIVNTASSTTQWDNANAAMILLEDPITTFLLDGIPYGISPGNHDFQPDMANFNLYFGESRFMGRAYYGGHYSPTGNENSYTLFSASGMDFIVIYLNYDTSPDADILNWADGLLQTHSDRRAIVVSHYLMEIGEGAAFGTQGAAIYNALKDNTNLFLMVSGHKHGEGNRVDVEPADHTIYTLLADYQGLPNGGNGWLRILTFSPANDEITFTTYSPTLDQYGTDAVMGTDTTSAEFTLSYDMDVSPPPGFTAYNDCVYDPALDDTGTDPNGRSVHYIAPNVTTFGIGGGFGGLTSGELLDQATGDLTGVTATLTESGGVNWQPDVSVNWYGGYDTAVGTDARDTFGGIADMTGVIYYANSAGWYVDLTFTGLARIFHESVLNRVFLGSGSSNCKVKKPIYVGIKKDFR